MKYEVTMRNKAVSAMFMSAEILSGRIDCVLSQARVEPAEVWCRPAINYCYQPETS